MSLTVDLITYKGLYESVETDKINFDSIDGQRTILPNHMDIIVPMAIGVVKTSLNGKERSFYTSDGMLELEDNHATIVCDYIVDIHKIDKSLANTLVEKAQDDLSNAVKETEVKRAKVALQRALSMLDAAEKYLG